jgi:hypothetical protein
VSQTAFAAAAGVIAVAMGMATFDRYLARRRPHELAWSLALLFFAIASFALALGARHGWNGFIFRTFFLFGAIINVPVLALGSLLLVYRDNPKRAQLCIYIVSAFCIFSAGVIISTPFTHPLPQSELAKGSEVFGALPRILAAVGSGVSAVAIIAIAISSALKSRASRYTLGNALIALGTAVTGMSGLLNSVVGEMNAFSITLAVGIAIIFSGFLVVTVPGTNRQGDTLSYLQHA